MEDGKQRGRKKRSHLNKILGNAEQIQKLLAARSPGALTHCPWLHSSRSEVRNLKIESKRERDRKEGSEKIFT